MGTEWDQEVVGNVDPQKRVLCLAQGFLMSGQVSRGSAGEYHSHPYMTTGKTIALTRQTYVDKVMSLLFNMLSRLVITFLPRGKCLLISWLQSPSAVILEPQKIKSATISTVYSNTTEKIRGTGKKWWEKNLALGPIF